MKKLSLLFIVLAAVALTSCWYNRKWDDIHPKTTSTSGCSDTLGISMSYSVNIAPLLTTYCSLNSPACHKAGSSFGGDLTVYANVAAYCTGNPSTIMSDITHAGNPMPKGQTKMPDCEIAKVAKWIQQGYPNN